LNKLALRRPVAAPSLETNPERFIPESLVLAIFAQVRDKMVEKGEVLGNQITDTPGYLEILVSSGRIASVADNPAAYGD
jgi:hypothetical protein